MKNLPLVASSDDLVGGLSLDGALQAVALLEVELGQIVLMAPQRADPALLRQDDGDGLLLDQRRVEIDVDDRRIGERRATAAKARSSSNNARAWL